MKQHLLVFGPGYSAQPIMQKAKNKGWDVTASYRNDDKKVALEHAGYKTVSFEAGTLENASSVTHILACIAPPPGGDPVLSKWESWLKRQNEIESFHYLSSTNVYGDHQGQWVDETTTPTPGLERGKRRVEAENAWRQLARRTNSSLFIYRLAGIYGPGRNALQSIIDGKARRIKKHGQIFGRIHQFDIAQTIWAAMNSKHLGGIFNLADDLPCPPQEVITHAASLLGTPAPAEEDIETATMSEMARSFYAESKRIKNDKIKQELNITLRYPSYKEGLAALLKAMDVA